MPIYTYTNTIPQAADLISDSQPPILENFQAIQELIEVNHVTFNTADFGKHKSVMFPDQTGSTPIFGGLNGLWAENYTVTGKPEIWYNNFNVVPANSRQYPITASLLSTNSTPGTGVDSWSYLPGGMIMKQGSGTTTAGAYTYSFPVAANIPVFTQVLTVVIGAYDLGASDTDTFVRLRNFTPTTIVLWGSARTTVTPKVAGFSYIAIGY